jgi:hypothetical protein
MLHNFEYINKNALYYMLKCIYKKVLYFSLKTIKIYVY